jgi:hypothetical protein
MWPIQDVYVVDVKKQTTQRYVIGLLLVESRCGMPFSAVHTMNNT